MTNENNIAWQYDFAGDSMFINEVKYYKYKESIEITDDIILDIDDENRAVALEILDASKVFGIEKKFIRNLVEIDIKVASTHENICIKASFRFLMHQRDTPKELNEQTVNNLGLNIHDTHLITPTAAK